MRLTIKAFGAAKDILGQRDNPMDTEINKVGDLRKELLTRYPELRDLRSILIAVNNAYADDAVELHESDEIALIPPVSGG